MGVMLIYLLLAQPTRITAVKLMGRQQTQAGITLLV